MACLALLSWWSAFLRPAWSSIRFLTSAGSWHLVSSHLRVLTTSWCSLLRILRSRPFKNRMQKVEVDDWMRLNNYYRRRTEQRIMPVSPWIDFFRIDYLVCHHQKAIIITLREPTDDTIEPAGYMWYRHVVVRKLSRAHYTLPYKSTTEIT